jgi:hypothetical protein
MSSGLGGLNKSPNGVVLGMCQLQLPVVKTKDDLAKQTERIVTLVGKAHRNLPAMDLAEHENNDDATVSSAVTTIVSNRTPGDTTRALHSQQVGK